MSVILLDLAGCVIKDYGSGTVSEPVPETEQIDKGLIDRLRGMYVIMVTWRERRYMLRTMTKIMGETGWRPAEAFFRDRRMTAPNWKRLVLIEQVAPRFQRSSLFAIESNPRTRSMYRHEGVSCASKRDFLSGKLGPVPLVGGETSPQTFDGRK